MDELAPLVVGSILSNGSTRVTFNGKALRRHPKYCNHSPTGFQWGYLGSGPAQLAFEILFAYIKASPEFSGECEISQVERALRLYQKFKQDIICRIPNGQPFTLTEIQLNDFLKGN